MALFSSPTPSASSSSHREITAEHLAKLPTTARHLCMPRPFCTPVELSFDAEASELLVDTGADRIVLLPVSGEPDWLIAAHNLGGLLVRVAPTSEPHKLALFASWEGQIHALVGEVR